MPNPPPKPIFGVEIEIFVKVKRDVQRDVERYRGSLPFHWREWDFNLSNRSTDSYKTGKQRICVKTALSALIKESLGSNGWKCVGDASLSEYKMREAPEADLWCKSFSPCPRRHGLTVSRGCRDYLAAHVGGQEMAK